MIRPPPTSQTHPAALDELLDLVQALRSAYGDDAVRSIAEITAEEPQRLRERMMRELEITAAEHAEELLEEWSPILDRAARWSLSLRRSITDLAVVIVDPLCPRLPEATDVFPDGASLHAREAVAELIADVAPATARALRRPPRPGTQIVVAFTFGRVLVCEREIEPIGQA